VTPVAADAVLVERVTVSEHFMVVEYIRERRARPRRRTLELVA
jgi:hypothetical protein